jgi:hypothetical protein
MLLTLGQPPGERGERADAERLAETYRQATPEQRRSLLQRGTDWVRRMHRATVEQMQRLIRAGSGGAVLESLRQSEGELREFLRDVGAGAAGAAISIGAVAVGLLLLFLWKGR